MIWIEGAEGAEEVLDTGDEVSESEDEESGSVGRKVYALLGLRE